MIRICKSFYKNNVAKLTLQIAEANVLQIKQDIRVTFPDKLGVIGSKKYLNFLKLYYAIIVCNFFSGGTLGLFTGASLISIAEIIYWIYVVTANILMQVYPCKQSIVLQMALRSLRGKKTSAGRGERGNFPSTTKNIVN